MSNAPGGSPPPADGPVGHSPLGTPSGNPEQAEALATELSHDLMSPYCPGRTIATCPSPNARKLEALILEQAQAGKSRLEIETALVQQFPDIRGYVGRPEIIYGTALVALIAIVGLVLAGRRWVRHGRQPAAMAAMSGAGAGAGVAAAAVSPESPASKVPTEPVVPPSAVAAPGEASRRELDALDDALDRIDEF
ncbi:MAG TPA: cytochrome c-type biogenesis protein CcmH [Nannocystis sp.]